MAPVSVAAPAQPVAPLAAPGRPASTGMTAPLVLNKLGGVVALAALTGKRMAFPRCKVRPCRALRQHFVCRWDAVYVSCVSASIPDPQCQPLLPSDMRCGPPERARARETH